MGADIAVATENIGIYSENELNVAVMNVTSFWRVLKRKPVGILCVLKTKEEIDEHRFEIRREKHRGDFPLNVWVVIFGD